MRPFNILRACFYLLAIVSIIQIIAAVIGGLGCLYMNFKTIQTPGACINIAELIKEQWTEILAAIMALLLASRGWPPNDKNDKNDKE